MVRARIALSLVLSLVVISGCDRSSSDAAAPKAETPKTTEQPAPKEAEAEFEPKTVDPPAGDGAMAPNLYPRPDGVGLSWLEPVDASGEDGDAMRLMHAVFEDGAWSKSQAVYEGGDFFANWADVPSVQRADDGTLFAHWPAKTPGGPYAYDVALARSADDGETWTRLGTAHTDDTASEHGFTTLLPAADGVRAVWLDGRHTVEEPRGAMTLRTTLVAADAIADSRLLDARVCDCCATDAVATERGTVVVYRDRDDKEVRDISVTRLVDDDWTEPAPVHDDGWTIAGCPVNGPAIAADGATLAVAWFTGAGQRSRVRVAFSDDSGASFGEPVEIDADVGDAAPLGRVDVVQLSDDEFGISWVDGAEDSAMIRLQRVSSTGHVGEVVDIAPTKRSRASGFPKLERLGDKVIAVWTEAAEPSKLRARTFSAESVPAASDSAPQASKTTSGPKAGWNLPYFVGESLDGETQRLAADDKALVVNFWATWCEPCRREMPMLDTFQDAHADDVRVVAVSVDEPANKDAVQAWVEEREPSFDVLLDPENRASSVFAVSSLPATFAFDSKGQLVWFKKGELESTQPVVDALGL